MHTLTRFQNTVFMYSKSQVICNLFALWCVLMNLDTELIYRCPTAVQWRHNERDSVSNHQPHDCLRNRLFIRRSKKTSKLRVTGLCAGNSPGTGEFPAQMASNSENVSIWWRHHGIPTVILLQLCQKVIRMTAGKLIIWFHNNDWFVKWLKRKDPPQSCVHIVWDKIYCEKKIWHECRTRAEFKTDNRHGLAVGRLL